MAKKGISNEDAQGEIEVAFETIRAHANKSLYGEYISDEECRAVATEVVSAIETYRAAQKI